MQIIVLFTVLIAVYLLPKTRQTAHKRSADNSMLLPVLEVELCGYMRSLSSTKSDWIVQVSPIVSTIAAHLK